MQNSKRATMVWGIVIVYVAAFLGVFVAPAQMQKEVYMTYMLIFTNAALAVIAVTLFYREWLDSIKAVGVKKFLLQVMLTAIIAISLGCVLEVLYSRVFGDASTDNQNLLNGAYHVAPVLMFVTSVVCAPIAEETIFRFLLQDWLKEKFQEKLRKKSALVAVLISSSAFGIMHSGLSYAYFVYAGVGIALGIIYEKTRSNAVVICVHLLNNLISAFI